MSLFDKPFVADPDQAQPTFTPIADDNYKLLIESAEEKPSKGGNAMLAMQCLVEEGEKTGKQYEGRKLFSNFNLEHPNPQVVEIAAKQLHALLILTGMKQLNDATELVGHTFKAHVKIKKRTDTGELQNEIVFAVKKGETVVVPEQSAPTAPTTAPKAGGKSGW